MTRAEFCKKFDVSKSKVQYDTKAGKIDTELRLVGGRKIWYIVENEKLENYEPTLNVREPEVITIKNSPAWEYRNDIVGRSCCTSLAKEIQL